jgi:hypothetical protein
MNAGDSRTGMARGGLNGHPKLKPKTPSGISLLTTEIGLDKGVHFTVFLSTLDPLMIFIDSILEKAGCNL